MRVRYRVQDTPDRGVGAFSPLPAVNPVASSYGLVHVFGAPGTLPVPAPYPAATPDPSNDPKTVSSACSPDVMTPAIYIASTRNMQPPVPTRIHNDMPVPAIGWQRVPKQALKAPPRLGGRGVIPWPRSFQRWPSLTGTTSA